MGGYLPLIWCRVVDEEGRQIGFVDPSTHPRALREEPSDVLVNVMLDWDSPGPLLNREELELKARQAISWGVASEDRLRRELERLFARHARGQLKPASNLLASLLVLRGKRFRPPIPRRLAVFSRSRLTYEGNELVAYGLTREEIPGLTPNLHLVTLTTFVGQARPWVIHVRGYRGYDFVQFQFATGTENFTVKAYINGGPDPYENIQLYPSYRKPEHVYSSDRGVAWRTPTAKPVSKCVLPYR